MARLSMTERQDRLIALLRSFDIVVDVREVALALDRFVACEVIAAMNRQEDGNE